jgi:RNA polymerase sigma factor (sigma-70 family)
MEMATSQASAVIQRLRRMALLQDGAGPTDRQLLEDYLGRGDPAALAALVRRHAPMVWGVCRRVLPNHHDAEDAFQATFLVLVRKAASIASRELFANWMYGVARQTALNARVTAARRRGRERQVANMPEPAVVDQDLWRDLQPVLDEELIRLPDKYRAVIVLCDLEGKTRKEAARQLAVPEGSVAGWLARARRMLAKRLAQRGVVLSGGALAAVLSQQLASAGVPNSVVSSTIKAASLFAAGQAAAVVSTEVAALTERVLKTMLLTKLKIATAVLITVGVVAGGTAIAPMVGGPAGYAATPPPRDSRAKDAPTPQPQGNDDEPNAKWPADPPRILEHDPYLLVPRHDGNILSVGCVAKELKLTDKQIDELWKLDRELSELLEDRGDAERRREYTKALHKKLPHILTSSQIKRFQQIGLQMLGTQAEFPTVGAMVYPEIQRTLKVSDEQKEAIRSLGKDARKEWDDEVNAMGGIDVPRACLLANKIHKATLAKALELLDKEQRATWDRITGEPFTFILDRFQVNDRGEYNKVADY